MVNLIILNTKNTSTGEDFNENATFYKHLYTKIL